MYLSAWYFVFHSILFSNWQGASTIYSPAFLKQVLLGPHEMWQGLLFLLAPVDGSMDSLSPVKPERSRQLDPLWTRGQRSKPDGILHSDREHATIPLQTTRCTSTAAAWPAVRAAMETRPPKPVDRAGAWDKPADLPCLEGPTVPGILWRREYF